MTTSAAVMSSPMPHPVAAVRTRALWILDRWRDLLLFVGTPALVVPLVAIGQQFFTAQTLYAVATFGALGHHLPGMMRAYGDRDLFARFRTRFVVAPTLLIVMCTAAAFVDPALSSIVLLTYLWGVWHGLMQTHGFLRIYDAKVGSTARRTVRLDQAMCVAWFGAAIVFSQPAVHHVLQEFYMAGGPIVGIGALRGVRFAWGAVVVVVTLAFIANAVAETRAGRAPSPVKLLLLGTSVGWWWYANVIVNNLLVGAVIFEMFHDVQYLSIVWLFNRKRVDGGSRVDAFTRFLFRQRGSMVLLYVGLVFAYGALRFVPDLPSAALNRLFMATLAASALLHFYYDSFIWKVKERVTRAGLGLAGGAETVVARGFRAWAPVTLRWAMLVLPVVWLANAFTHGEASATEKMQALGRDFPHYSLARNNLAVALAADGDIEGAIEATRRVIQMEREDRGLVEEAKRNLGALLVDQAKARLRTGDRRGATTALREAATLRPGLATRLRDEGVELARNGQAGDALVTLYAALVLDPTDPTARELATRLAQSGAAQPGR